MIKRDARRQQSKGFGLLVAAAIAYFFLTYWMELLRMAWPWYMQIKTDYQMNPVYHIALFTIPNHIINYTVANLIMCVIYKSKLQIFESERSRGSPDEKWPWETMEPTEWNNLFWRSIKFTVFNSTVCNLIVNLIVANSGQEVLNPTDIDKMPGPMLFAAQIVFCMVVEDMVFFCSHRTLHHPILYPSVHKIHHEHKVTFSLAALHAHPLEYIMGNVLPVMVGPALLGPRMHLASMFGWYFLRSWESMDGHCGYSFSWSPFRLLPCQPEGNYHFFHHEENVGNYGSFFTWWDTIFGTNSAFYKQ